MINLITCLLALYYTTVVFQNKEIKVYELTIDRIPKELSFKGSLIEAKKWEDASGQNILIVSKKGPFLTPNAPNEGAESLILNAYQYNIRGFENNLQWQYSDSIVNCNLVMGLDLFPNSTRITDLDGDGSTETTLIYNKFCKGDVSTPDMIIMVFECKDIYGLRGVMYSDYSIGEINKSTFQYDLSKTDFEKLKNGTLERLNMLVGRYRNEDDFKNAPNEFLVYARNKWKEYFDKDKYSYIIKK